MRSVLGAGRRTGTLVAIVGAAVLVLALLYSVGPEFWLLLLGAGTLFAIALLVPDDERIRRDRP